jgi:hypothetical protein
MPALQNYKFFQIYLGQISPTFAIDYSAFITNHKASMSNLNLDQRGVFSGICPVKA